MIIAVLQIALLLSRETHYLRPVQDFCFFSFSSAAHLDCGEPRWIEDLAFSTAVTRAQTLLRHTDQCEQVGVMAENFKLRVFGFDSCYCLFFMES